MTDPEDPGGFGLHVDITDEQSIPVDTAGLERIATHALKALRMRGALSVALVDPERMTDLKARFYGQRAQTDVLSFPMDGPQGPVIGDVVICPAVAKRQAAGLGVPFGQEMAQLLVHGIIHLSGRDHAVPGDEITMAADERAILESA